MEIWGKIWYYGKNDGTLYSKLQYFYQVLWKKLWYFLLRVFGIYKVKIKIDNQTV